MGRPALVCLWILYYLRKMNIDELKHMTEKERIEALNHEIEQRQKRLMSEGIYPHSISWIIGKSIILKEVGKEFNIIFHFDESQEPFLDKFKLFWAKIIMFFLRNLTMVKIFDKIIKMPRALFPRWVYEMDGLKLQMDEGDIEMRPILKDYQLLKIWEPETTKIVKEQVKPGMTCIDIGGSIGIFTLQFARLVGPTGMVFTFEPTEMNFDYQCQNIRLNGFEDICYNFKMGAWHKWEVLPFPRCAAKPFWTNGVPVADFLNKNFGVKKIDFIKIDVDGAEPNVVKGLIPIFENNPQLKMVIEYYPKYIRDAGLDPLEYKTIIEKYFNYTIIPGDYSGDCENWYCIHK